MTYSTWTATASLAAAVLTGAGCGDDVLEPQFDDDRQGYVVEVGVGELVQTLELSDIVLEAGDTLYIRSVVVNKGRDREIEARICGVDIRGLEIEYVSGCDGYSMQGILQSGDLIRSVDWRIVGPQPGTYRVRIRHLLDPELWVPIELIIRAR